MMSIRTSYDLGDRLIDFSVLITDIVEALPPGRIGNHIGHQLLRSGTSAAPNHAEAQSGESRRDLSISSGWLSKSYDGMR